VIANGSLEHFVSPRDDARGRADDVYRGLFDIVCDLLVERPNAGRSGAGHFVTTAIHFGGVTIDPRDMLRPLSHFRRGSAEHHYALLVHGFGGFSQASANFNAAPPGGSY
jgi:hypothetical protein